MAELPATKSKVFRKSGSTFILGAFAGYTVSRIKRMIEDAGGKVSSDITDVSIERVIVSPIIWGQQGTAGASLVIKKIILANAANYAETDSHEYRVWILPLEYVLSSIELEELLDPEENDLELTVAQARIERAEALLAERKANGGKSKYAPGERKKVEGARKAKLAEEQMERERKMAEVEAVQRIERERVWAEKVRKNEEQRATNDPYYGALLKARTDAVAAAAALAKSPIDLTGPSTSFTGMGQKLGGTPTTKKAVAPTQKIPEKKRMWEKTDWNKVGGTPSGSGSGSGSGGGNAEASGSGLKPREKRALELKEQNEKRQKFLDDFEAQGIPMPNKKRRVETLTLSDSDDEPVIVDRMT